jgi:hypothetical protein
MRTMVTKLAKIEEIMKSKGTHKKKAALLAERVREDRKLASKVIECFKVGSVAEKGHCMEAMHYVSQDEPDIVLPYIDFIVDHFDDGGTRVKWEAAEIIHNVARKYPEKVTRAIPKLLASINDRSTVARWSVAYALTEIAKNNPGSRKELIPKFREILEKEKNHGVRNIYVKALESMGGKKGH